MVGFAIYNSLLKKYRQVRAPMGGGIRYPRVEKNTTKAELLRIVCPLFFPNGKNCHGEVTNFSFDIATDVHGTQLMHVESVEDIMERLGLKHFRCYLLAKRITIPTVETACLILIQQGKVSNRRKNSVQSEVLSVKKQ